MYHLKSEDEKYSQGLREKQINIYHTHKYYIFKIP